MTLSVYNKGGVRFYMALLVVLALGVAIYTYIYRNPVYTSAFTDIARNPLAPAELKPLPYIPTAIDTTPEPELAELCKRIDTGKPMTDTAFLEAMIPHHQVAIAVCRSMNSDNQIIREFCRQMIWQQEYEITQMEAMIGRLPLPFSEARARLRFTQSLYDFYNPPTLAMVKQPVCDPMHFKSAGGHMASMPQLSDEDFLKHMAVHHATAVKMAKTQMRTTGNSFIAALCYDLIHQQEIELVKMNEMIDNQAWMTSIMQ